MRSPRPALGNLLELITLWVVAAAQPLLDLLGRNPEFFVARDSPSGDVIGLAFVIVFVPPLALWLVELAAGLAAEQAGRIAHFVLVGVLAAALALLVAVRAGGDGWLVVVLAAAIGAAAAYARFRARELGTLLRVLSPGAVLLIGWFLLVSPAHRVAFPSDDPTGLSRTSAGATAPVVFVVFDQLPTSSLLRADGTIDAGLFPNFARLAERSTFFPNVAAMSNHTTRAVPAILTGQAPRNGLLPVASDHPENLFTWLGRSHELHVDEPITRLCPAALCPQPREPAGPRLRSLASDLAIVYGNLALPETLRGDMPAVTGQWYDFGNQGGSNAVDQKVVAAVHDDRAVRFARAVRRIGGNPGGRPPLEFMHVVLPHFPFRYLPSGKQYEGRNLSYTPGLIGEIDWTDEPLFPALLQQRHMLQLAATDRLLGTLLDRLEEQELLERAAVVVTADHGIPFEAGESIRAVNRDTVSEQAAVPLFLKAPGQRTGRQVEDVVQSVDVLPSLAELLGAELPWRAEGASVLSAEPRDRLTVYDTEGKPLTVAPDEFVAGIRSALRRKLDLFGSGRVESLYALGRRDIVGRPLAEAGVETLEIDLEQEDALASVDPAADVVPVYLEGTIRSGGEPTGEPIAIAVNGRVVTLSHSYPRAGGVRFAAMIPESSLRPGRNEVSALRLEGLGDGAPRPSGTWRLVTDEQGTGLVRSGRARVPVEAPGDLQGVVDTAGVSGDVISFGGWAADGPAERAAERIVAIVGGNGLEPPLTRVPRPDVASALGSERIRRAGFAFELPAGLLDDDGRGAIRVFALSGGRAVELAYPPGYAFAGP